MTAIIAVGCFFVSYWLALSAVVNFITLDWGAALVSLFFSFVWASIGGFFGILAE